MALVPQPVFASEKCDPAGPSTISRPSTRCGCTSEATCGSPLPRGMSIAHFGWGTVYFGPDYFVAETLTVISLSSSVFVGVQLMLDTKTIVRLRLPEKGNS